MLEGLASILQVIVGLGLLNVWLIRARSATSYRGGDAQNLKSEFATYGLPSAAFYIVGGLKILAGVLLLVGFAYQPVVAPAAAVVAVLMDRHAPEGRRSAIKVTASDAHAADERSDLHDRLPVVSRASAAFYLAGRARTSGGRWREQALQIGATQHDT